MSAELSAALVAGIVALVTAILTALVTIVLSEQRLKRDFRLDFAAERVANGLLARTKWRLRTFDVLRHHLGGFPDDDLRQILVKAGAIRFASPSGIELWGLLDRTEDLLGVPTVPWEPTNQPNDWPFSMKKLSAGRAT
jgi:hypothetical protein